MAYRDKMDSDSLLRFIESIAKEPSLAPSVLFFTGGEPFLRAAEIRDIVSVLAPLETKFHAISGGYFLRNIPLSPGILETIGRLDSLSISWDRYHQEFMEEAQLLAGLCVLQATGVQLSIQFAYHDQLEMEDAKRKFEGFPIFFSPIANAGRANDNDLAAHFGVGADVPCRSAAWPVISYNGQIVSCCNQDIIDAEPANVPAHLLLGTIWDSSWSEVVSRRRTCATITQIETLGPASLSEDCTFTLLPQCVACRKLPSDLKPRQVSKALRDAVAAIHDRSISGQLRGVKSDV
jgi:hypothetical protein